MNIREDKYISYQESKLNVDELILFVQSKKYEYYNKYHQEPKYIKLPVWIQLCLQFYHKQLIGYSEHKELPTYVGLIICSTTSISRLDEIEVF